MILGDATITQKAEGKNCEASKTCKELGVNYVLLENISSA